MTSTANTQPASYRPQPDPYADEISLFDLWDILLRRRWWILGLWAFTVAAAVGYLLTAQPVYESRAVVRIGQVAGDLITPPATLALELREHFETGEPGRERPLLKSVKQEGNDVLILISEAYSAEEAQQFLQKTVRDIGAFQQRRFEDASRLQENALAAVDEQIEGLAQQARHLGEVASSASIDEAVKALLILQRSSLQTDLPALHAQRLRLQRDLSVLRTYPTQMIREATLAEKPSAPRRALILALALVLGGMLGSMAAFVIEFLHNARNRPLDAY